jgi:hypothetical protein
MLKQLIKPFKNRVNLMASKLKGETHNPNLANVQNLLRTLCIAPGLYKKTIVVHEINHPNAILSLYAGERQYSGAKGYFI